MYHTKAAMSSVFHMFYVKVMLRKLPRVLTITSGYPRVMSDTSNPTPRLCPQCGLPLSPSAILCPRCQSVVVASQSWESPLLDKRGIAPAAKRRTGMIWLGVLAANIVAALMVGLSLWISRQSPVAATIFISSDFTLVPAVMGLIGAFCWKDLRLSSVEYFLYSLPIAVVGLLGGGIFMGEGAICLVIVSPLLFGFVFLGTLLGRWLFALGNSRLNFSLIPLALSFLMIDIFSPHHFANSVSDAVVVKATPAQVWSHLAVVPLITSKPDYWLFRAGLPYPVQATSVGAGVGATRRCIFSKNTVFEEKITHWEPGRRLTFDVTRQPSDPEILGHARVLRGQFDLKDNGDGTTTLTGTSWYELYVYPAAYYDLWAGSIARHVHTRVMDHIKTLSETGL